MRIMRGTLVAALLTGMMWTVAGNEEEEFDAVKALPVQIAEMAKLLEDGKIKEFLMRAIPPEERKKAFEGAEEPPAEFVEHFKVRKAKDLQNALKATTETEPKWNDEKTQATYEFSDELREKHELRKRPLRFILIEKMWYILN